MRYDAVVIGTSAGGLVALKQILPKFDVDIPIPIMIVQHMDANSDDFLVEYLNKYSRILIQYAEDKEIPVAGHAYIAPANYHLMVEEDRALALSSLAKVNYSRPSIDVLFETAAEAYLDRLIGVILTGANHDGSEGLRYIKRLGGVAVVQSPESAEIDVMPKSAIEKVDVDHIVPLDKIGTFLNQLIKNT